MAGGNRNWIAGAISHPGALTRKAKAAGVPTMEFAAQHRGDKGRTGKQARLALILRTIGQRHRARQKVAKG